MAMVELTHVRKAFGDHLVLRDVTLQVDPGEVCCIIGPSGGGKSTVLRCINRLVTIDAGDVIVDGLSVRDPAVKDTELRRRVGMVFQQFNLFGHMTALQNVTLGPRKVRGMGREQADDLGRRLLAKVDLSAKADAYPASLSGGQQQRVAIARALAMEPKVMLFDEATSALDTQTEKEIQDSLRQISHDVTTLVIAHRLSTVVHADEILVLDKGVVVERGRHEELLAKGGLYAALWSRQREVDAAEETLRRAGEIESEDDEAISAPPTADDLPEQEERASA